MISVGTKLKTSDMLIAAAGSEVIAVMTRSKALYNIMILYVQQTWIWLHVHRQERNYKVLAIGFYNGLLS